MGTSSPSLKGAQPHQIFGPYLLPQMAAWIKMSLDVELGLGTGDFVLDGTPLLLPKRGAEPPSTNFRPMFIVAKRLDG